jgi:hypothetical protein
MMSNVKGSMVESRILDALVASKCESFDEVLDVWSESSDESMPSDNVCNLVPSNIFIS